MIEERDLDAAVAAGVLDEATRRRLVGFVRDLRAGTAGADEERFRLLTGFNDVFVSIAIGLLLVALGSLFDGAAGPLAAAAASWALAEYFTRKRRMALPSILLLLSFVGAAFMLGLEVAGDGDTRTSSLADVGAFLLGGGAAVAAAVAHWYRFMVPITVAAGAAALSLLVVVFVGSLVSGVTDDMAGFTPIVALCGLAVFGLAMWYDSRDLARVTRWTDVAFWLHLLAAPMIIHPVFVGTGLLGGATEPLAAVVVVLIYGLLTVVALAIDRRALLVSALVYVIYAIRTLLERGGDMSAGFGLTALIIGLFLVLLSAAWRPVRRVVLGWLPDGVRARLPLAA